MKSVYSLSGAVFCFALGLLLSTAQGSLTTDVLPSVAALLVGVVFLVVGLSSVMKENAEKDAARNTALEQYVSTLLDTIHTLHVLKEPVAELKLVMEQQEQNETARHHGVLQMIEQSNRHLADLTDIAGNIRDVNKNSLEAIHTLLCLKELLTELRHTLEQQEQSEAQRHHALLAQLEQSERNYRDLPGLILQIKEQDKRNSEAIFRELYDLRSDSASNSEQKIEILNQLESYADEMKESLRQIQKQQKQVDGKLFDALENIEDAVKQTIPDLKNSMESQNEANRKFMAQVMETYSQLSSQDIELLNKILEETNGR